MIPAPPQAPPTAGAPTSGSAPGMPAPAPPAAPLAPPSGPPPVTIDAVMALLRDGMMRRFRIDIEVDSTIAGDESQERQDRMSFIESTTKFVQAWGPVIAANPAMAPLAGELLLFGSRAFRIGSSMEEVIEETVDKLEQQAAQPKPPPPPNPVEESKIQQAQIKANAEGQKAAAGVQTSQIEAAADQQAARMDLAGKAMEHQHTTATHAMEMEKLRVEAAVNEAKAAAHLRQQQGIDPNRPWGPG